MAGWLKSVWLLYADGFRNMTIGRTLWIVIIVKLAIIFFVVKLIFFPDFLSKQSCSRQEYVSRQLTSRHP